MKYTWSISNAIRSMIPRIRKMVLILKWWLFICSIYRLPGKIHSIFFHPAFHPSAHHCIDQCQMDLPDQWPALHCLHGCQWQGISGSKPQISKYVLRKYFLAINPILTNGTMVIRIPMPIHIQALPSEKPICIHDIILLMPFRLLTPMFGRAP